MGSASHSYAFESTKTYVHATGLSCCFRQHRAKSHCSKLHGYALQVELTFGCHELDENGWVQDFGGLKLFKAYLEGTFDHKLLVAKDDPDLDNILLLGTLNIADVVVVDHVGVEAFAQMILLALQSFLDVSTKGRVWVKSVYVKEHQGNGARFYNLTGSARRPTADYAQLDSGTQEDPSGGNVRPDDPG